MFWIFVKVLFYLNFVIEQRVIFAYIHAAPELNKYIYVRLSE
jgi:hypothetical protein